jgi:thioredoxin 2
MENKRYLPCVLIGGVSDKEWRREAMSNLRLDMTGVIVPCPKCGQKNRVPFRRLGETGQCGKCGGEIAPPSEPIEVESVGAFDTLIRESALPVLVDFWAEWCGPCKMVAPEIVKVAQMAAEKLIVVKVNTEKLPALASRYGIMSIPMLAVFSGGKEVARSAGARPADAIYDFVQQALGKQTAATP